MTDPDRPGEVALEAAVRRARAQRVTIAGQRDWAVDLSGAYAVQERLARGRAVIGYKLGLVSAVKQRQIGIGAPIFGRIFEGMVRRDRVTLRDVIQPRLEPEIALRLVAAVRHDDDDSTILDHIGGFHLGVDVLGSIWDGYAFEKGATKASGGEGWADVWRRGRFAWEYKGKHKGLDAAHRQLLQYAGALENPPLLVTSDIERITIRTNWTNAVSERHEVRLGCPPNYARI